MTSPIRYGLPIHYKWYLFQLQMASGFDQYYPVEITINSMVKAVVKTTCHPILYNGPPQQHNEGLRYTIVFSSTILLTRVLYPPINTVCPQCFAIRLVLHHQPPNTNIKIYATLQPKCPICHTRRTPLRKTCCEEKNERRNPKEKKRPE